MRLLVTGGAGFIGSHFIRAWSAAHPADHIANVDLLTYAGAMGRLGEGSTAGGYEFVQANICNAQAIEPLMRGCDVVVHFAAETHVDRSITDAAPFLRTNVEGAYTVVRCAASAGVKRLIHVSTDEVYGPVLTGAVDEAAALAPRSPYAASKAAGDLLVQAARETFGLQAVIVRPTNIYGPGQFPEKFIPLCITNALDGRVIPVYGDGRQRRGWLFVTDLCEALRVVIERGAVGEIYNVGSGHEQANLETVQAILAALGGSKDLIQFVADRPGHDRRYAMHDAKMRALGWQPRVTFAQGLAETVQWYRDHAAWWRPLTEKLREDSYHWLNRPARPGADQPSRTRG